jgi:hypothetical protein
MSRTTGRQTGFAVIKDREKNGKKFISSQNENIFVYLLSLWRGLRYGSLNSKAFPQLE